MALVNVILLLCVALSGLTSSLAETIDVTKYGAAGDGETDDSQAFLKAWEATCGASGGTPTLNVPSGKTFFLNPLVFAGPCQPSAIQIQIDGNVVAPSGQGAWTNCEANTWISFKSASGLNIQGKGTLDAKGSVWWDQEAQHPRLLRRDSRRDTHCSSGTHTMGSTATPEGVCKKPTTFRLIDSNSTHLTGLRFLNSGGSHINIDKCNDVFISNITITAPGNSLNTDGIDIITSRNIQIRDSNIGTGDDCIAINTNCFNVNISGIACGPGHGISVGSLGKDGSEAAIDGIYVQHCTFTNTEASARIKTWPGGSGFARNILFEHITLNDVKSGIAIDQHYLATGEEAKAVQVSGVHFVDVQGTGEQILLDCSANEPCQQIYLQDVNIASSVSGQAVNATCSHANAEISNVTPQLSCNK